MPRKIETALRLNNRSHISRSERWETELAKWYSKCFTPGPGGSGTNRRKDMKIKIICVLFAAVLFCQPGFSQGEPPVPGPAPAPAADKGAGAPKAVVPEKSFDAGTVIKGETFKHEFTIENTGSAPLEILSVKPGCGCTTPEYDRKIEPGKKGRISLAVNTTAFVGSIKKSTAVKTNDPDNASFDLFMKATVKAMIEVQPSENQAFGIVRKGEKIERDYKLNSSEGTPFKVTEIQCTDNFLKHNLNMAPDGKSGVLTVTVPEDHPLGVINAHLTLKTDHPKQPMVELNAYATVREDLAIDPAVIHFGNIGSTFFRGDPGNSSWVRYFTLYDDTGTPIQIKGVRSTYYGAKVSYEQIEAGKRYLIKVQLLPAAKDGEIDGKIILETSKKVFEVPLYGKIG